MSGSSPAPHGASGLEIAREALRRGHHVAVTSRNADHITAALGSHPDLAAITLDVTDRGQIRDAIDQAVSRFGHIDVLVNNAGQGLVGAVEETTDP